MILFVFKRCSLFSPGCTIVNSSICLKKAILKNVFSNSYSEKCAKWKMLTFSGLLDVGMRKYCFSFMLQNFIMFLTLIVVAVVDYNKINIPMPKIFCWITEWL